MRVDLIQATENAKDLITRAASICYGKEEAKDQNKLLRTLYRLGHHSVMEHIYFTWKIEGISRACLAQLTRHRHASFTVESQRYTKYSEGLDIVNVEHLPEEAKDKYLTAMTEASINYKELLELGVKAEDARMVLPNAAATNLYMSCNLRELMHLNSIRTAKGAQKEIKDLINLMTELVVENEPDLTFMFVE